MRGLSLRCSCALLRAGMSFADGVCTSGKGELPLVVKLGMVMHQVYWVLLDLCLLLFAVFWVKLDLWMYLSLRSERSTISRLKKNLNQFPLPVNVPILGNISGLSVSK